MNAPYINLNAFLEQLEDKCIECKVEFFQPALNEVKITIVTRETKRDVIVLRHAINRHILKEQPKKLK